ncbi:Gp49 family protein [Sphingomonas oligoaromativorans]|uniref:Gp49 family protein n=1 Tax=Sphingomonas oligoaromativorans TaxID=575322 RepID=UPI0014228F4B|nr:Gp49 family protein [Sphingomonas oligoaromativorans]NIJ34325.1 hypothetical protein [Sphingomonas oligoaromativorans]
MIDDVELKARLGAQTAPKVGPERVEAVIAERLFVRPTGTLTICVLTLANGFTVTGESACASPENYNQEIGEKIAFDNAKQKIWALEGYALRDRLAYRDTLIASIAHEVNRAWCAYNGDDSQPNWADAPGWQRDSAITGVAFHRANPEAGDAASHDSWMREKVAAGWVYGEQKDPDAHPPTHPCIVPFEDLPREQQFKDRLFRTIVHAAIAAEAAIVP